jgi:predicted Zn-dependent peptidase
MRRLLPFLLLLAAGATPLAAQGLALPVREHLLANGLRLLVLEQPGNPRVAAKIFTDVGPLIEVPGELGAVHFLEHLMFKGTPTLGTTDWAAERPLQERLLATERALIEERNRTYQQQRERGVFHDYRHADSSPRIDSLRAEIARLDREVQRYRDHGTMMRWYQAFGGTYLTATTEQEYMKFDINLPAERVALFLRVEADRMRNSVFREFDEERMIVVEQRYGDLNRPTTPFYEAMSSLTQTVSPVFWPEGYLSDFENYTRTGIRETYERYFVPNNTTIVLVGGVRLEEMVPLVDHYFGWMERAPEPPRNRAVEPVPQAERRLVWRSTELEPRVEARYLIPGVGHPDRPHFDVLAELAEEELRRSLRAEGIAARPNVNTNVIHTSRYGVPSTINFEVVVAREAELEAAERVLLATLGRLGTGEDVEDRLAVARKRVRTAWHRVAQDPDRLGFEIGHFQTMDSWRTLQPYLEARERTGAADLRRLAERYFIPENRSVGVVRRPEAATPSREES